MKFRGFAFILAALLLLSRCANVAQGPTGGPKDTIPPVLVRTIPGFYALNTRPKKVVLQFNEYVQLKEASKNVTVSPPSITRPEIRTRGKGVEVVFSDTLKQNTTYTIDYGIAISDLNEGNHFPAFRYVFSTGAAIDSMMITGKVFDAYTREPIPLMTVALYEDRSDTAIYKTMPLSVSRTDNWGYFSLQNIKPADYLMVAFLDKNNNYRYDAGTEMLAFTDSTVTPTAVADMKTVLTVIDPIDTLALRARPYEQEMYAFTENVGKQFLKEQTMPAKRQINLVFNRPQAVVDTFLINGLDSAGFVIEHSRFHDSLTYWITAPVLPDTMLVNISYLKTDSLEQLSPFSAKLKLQLEKEEKKDTKKKAKDEEEKAPTLQTTINFSAESIIKNGVAIVLPTLIMELDTSKIHLSRLDEKDKKKKIPEKYVLTRDTIKIRRYVMQTKWQTGAEYELQILPGAFTDIYGLTNDTIVKTMATADPGKFSSIVLSLSGVPPGEQVIMHLMDNQKKLVLREELLVADGKFTFEYLKPGKYALRFIRDNNKNGIWDPGNYLEHRQSEPAEFYTLPDGSELIELPENTELSQSVNVSTVFARNRKDELPKIIHTHDDEDDDHGE